MIRSDAHSGSWYDCDSETLQSQLTQWLDKVPDCPPVPNKRLRCVIVPHAGYAYSGSTAAKSYAPLRQNKSSITRVFIIGPSHHVYMDKCALTTCSEIKTPFGNLQVDVEHITRLRHQHPSLFTELSKRREEAGHSLEMQFP